MELINDGLKHVAQSVELIKEYIILNDIDNDSLLQLALVLLEKAIEKLTTT